MEEKKKGGKVEWKEKERRIAEDKRGNVKGYWEMKVWGLGTRDAVIVRNGEAGGQRLLKVIREMQVLRVVGKQMSTENEEGEWRGGITRIRERKVTEGRKGY